MSYFVIRWQSHGHWAYMNHMLREQLRQKLGRAVHPGALATDSQSVKPKRWAVERTFGWLNGSRHLSKDYERLPEMSEAAIYAVMIRVVLKRLAT
jgi:transposase